MATGRPPTTLDGEEKMRRQKFHGLTLKCEMCRWNQPPRKSGSDCKIRGQRTLVRQSPYLIPLFLVLSAGSGHAQEWWSAPTDLGAPLTSAPSAVTGGPHSLDVLYRGPNNHLFWSWWP